METGERVHGVWCACGEVGPRPREYHKAISLETNQSKFKAADRSPSGLFWQQTSGDQGIECNQIKFNAR